MKLACVCNTFQTHFFWFNSLMLCVPAAISHTWWFVTHYSPLNSYIKFEGIKKKRKGKVILGLKNHAKRMCHIHLIYYVICTSFWNRRSPTIIYTSLVRTKHLLVYEIYNLNIQINQSCSELVNVRVCVKF